MAAFTTEELQSMIIVNMGDYKTAKGSRKLITKDLGSCVGIAMRDPETGIGGLLHIMLPQYMPNGWETSFTAAKYADTGLDELAKALVQQGAVRERLVAKLAGAAHMVKVEQVPESRDISSRNLAAVRKKLAELNIPVLASDVGDYYPRTVVFEPESGALRIIAPGKAEKTI
ncbi:MAG: chemotaxis protein CheD [Lachnospiraceae bacterium]|nr:chemotaxis protein CheD [Lachnospiraceae bacterium]